MKNNPTLSISIITYNEEKNIGDCLASVSEIADEIVVLDSISTDRTEEICRKNPKVTFYQHPFDGHIQQKNRALEKCLSEWILCIDADERVSRELGRSIRKILDKNPDIAGVKFPRLSFHMHRYIRHGGWYPNARYRLIRKGMAYWGGENPHDKLLLKGKGKKIKGDLIHYTATDLSDSVKTINQFSSITALTRYNKGKKYRLWRLLLKPVSKFFEIYIYKYGFLDGIQGFIIAISSSYSSFLKEAKLFELSVLGSDKPSNLSSLFEKKNDSDRP
ncbi:MAG: glycosyltransferase family 2 protein [Deltaproteobacteria bacterium]|nr:glycosyltransferase family 2 protein [Deltaproteobacteria bacterium]